MQTVLGWCLFSAHAIIWDEAMSTHRHNLEALDRSLKDICGNEQPFGGKVVLLMGAHLKSLQ